MSIFLDWEDIELDGERLEAKERYNLEVKQLEIGVGLTMEAFELKQAIIRIYSASNPAYIDNAS